MRIVIIAHNVIRGDGQGRVNLEIVRHALAAGHDVQVIAANVDPEVAGDGGQVELVRLARRPVLARVIQFVYQSDRILDRLQAIQPADAVIANGYTTTRPHNLNLCQFVHAAWLPHLRLRNARGLIDWTYQQAFTRFNAVAERKTFAKAAHIVTPSRITAAEARAVGVPAGKMSVIPNGVDLKDFRPGPAERAAIGLPSGLPIILFAGDLRTNRKGLHYLLQAMRYLPGVHLAVVGREAGSPFVPLAVELGVAERVTFLGFRHDVAAVMRACDLFVFPSSYEPYGMVVTEALACGLPVITTAATGASELVTEDVGTVLPNPTDVDALIRAIKGWVDTPGRTAEAREACRHSTLSHGWPTMADQYMRQIDEHAHR